LISNALWIRASDLQDEDKFFEMAQLADWITKLEPHFVQVWLVQAWNMAYNISVKFKDKEDRWRWVSRGIALLRDEGLKYNPHETLIYRELGWFFQHKMGQNLDDWHKYYKQQWANEMARVFAKKTPDLDELINPQTDDARERAKLLREKYKMDPAFMKEVNERYGPLEWRLPEAHAVYWGAYGLKDAAENPGKVKQEDLMQLRRLIYQSMQLSFHRGKMVSNVLAQAFETVPNLEIIPKVNASYEEMYAEEKDPAQKDGILKAHRNFLRDAVYFLYQYNRVSDAAQWYRYLGEKYPNKFVIDGDTNSFPRNVSLEEYCVARIKEDLGETDPNRIQAAIEGAIARAYQALLSGQDDLFRGFRALALKARESYMSKVSGKGDPAEGPARTRIATVEETEREFLKRLLDPETHMMPYEVRAALRFKLGLPPETAPAPGTTNTPPASIAAPSVVPGK
jgi:hypothetical protein